MTSTTARAILALADNAAHYTISTQTQAVVLAALLPNHPEAAREYQRVAHALYNRNQYDEDGIEFAAVMLAQGDIAGDADAYQVSEEGSIGLDPALAVEPEREAWDARARDIAERMAQVELDAHAETVIRS